MAVSRAEVLLPPDLLYEIQKYVQGQEIYIPKLADNHARWGECSGIRADLARRNSEIVIRYNSGATIDELMAEFHLGYDSVRKILREQRKNSPELNWAL